MNDKKKRQLAESMQLLTKAGTSTDRVRVELSREAEPPFENLAVSSGAVAIVGAQATAPFVVWLDNQSWANLDVQLYWGQYDVPGVQQTGGTVYSGQVAPFILGGVSGCGSVYAYVLQILYQGNVVGNTGVVQPDASDGAPCSDAWAVG